MKILGLIGLSILIACACLVVAGSFVADPTPQQRAFADMRTCERRVGIPAPTDSTYPVLQQAYYAAYLQCMMGLGYTTATLP